jgi:branched-chain amino acid aminotransferase
VLSTAPEKEVLPGITRKYVLEIARKEQIPLQERIWSLAELNRLVSVFISGTSPKVLPVKQIDNHVFDVAHPLLRLLMERFERVVQENLTRV